MHIDIYFDYLIDLIREAHTAEETAQILKDICNLDGARSKLFNLQTIKHLQLLGVNFQIVRISLMKVEYLIIILDNCTRRRKYE